MQLCGGAWFRFTLDGGGCCGRAHRARVSGLRLQVGTHGRAEDDQATAQMTGPSEMDPVA